MWYVLKQTETGFTYAEVGARGLLPIGYVTEEAACRAANALRELLGNGRGAVLVCDAGEAQLLLMYGRGSRE